MPIFLYRGYRESGDVVTGTIEADGPKDALQRIKELGLFPKEIKESLPKEKRFSLRSDISLLPSVTRLIATLLSSGVPVIDAISAVASEEKGYWQKLLVGIKDRVASGSSLSRAIEAYPKVFPEFYVSMVAAGEASGALDKVLLRLADFLEAQASLRSRVKTATVYPIFMVFVSIGVLSFLFTFVVPKITKIFEDTKSALPLVTVILIWISNIFHRFWWLLLGLLTAGVFGFQRFINKKREVWDSFLLRVPGNTLNNLYMSRFTRTLGLLLRSGLPILRALELSARTVGNTAIEKKVRKAGERVIEGASLSSALKDAGGFPPILLHMIATGERSGEIEDILDRAAAAYEAEFDRGITRSVAILEPGLILAMGLVVGFIVISILLPIFQLNQLIK